MQPDLQTLQRLLQRLIATPAEVLAEMDAAGELIPGGVAALIAGDRRLSALRRLQIYADSYFERLLEVMREDFPAARAALGDQLFTRLVREYLAAHPPAEPSVFGVGRELARFLAAYREVEPYIAELAALERATIEVFHGPDAAALDAEALRAVAPERWPAMRLRTHPAFRLLDCRWDVAPMLRAIAEGTAWSKPAPAPVSVAVWRQHAQVFYRTLEPGEREALAAAAGGATFAEICAAASQGIAGDAVAAINRMLARWLSDGMLTAIEA